MWRARLTESENKERSRAFLCEKDGGEGLAAGQQDPREGAATEAETTRTK